MLNRVLKCSAVLLFLAVPVFAAEKKSDQALTKPCGCSVKVLDPESATNMMLQQMEKSHHLRMVANDGPGDLQNRDPGTGSGCTSVFMTCWYTWTYIGDNYVEVVVDCTC
jgi:hypothetical protein